MIDSIRTRKASIRVQPYAFQVDTSQGPAIAEAHRIILEGTVTDRSTYRPAPHQMAVELEGSLANLSDSFGRDKKTVQIFRRAAVAYGVPFSILACIYFGYTASNILQVFDDKNFRDTLKKEREKVGIKRIRMPRSDHRDEHTELHNLVRAIRPHIMTDEGSQARPIYNADSHIEALRVFDHFPGYKRDLTEECSQFLGVDDKVIPRAVFAGLDEIAQRIAPRNFLDPFRRIYIDGKFGEMGTTQLITAYFETQLQTQQSHFAHLIKGK